MNRQTKTITQRSIWLLLLAPFLLVGCRTDFTKEKFKPFVIDEAGILDKATTEWLNSYSYPNGFAFVVRSVKTLSEREVGYQADQLFEADAQKCPNVNACTARGVYVVISQQPALIQVRVGSQLARSAQWEGVTSGKTYIEKQLLATNGKFNESLRTMIEWLSTSLPVATHESWFRWVVSTEVTDGLYFELERLSLPTDSLYGNYILTPFIQARAFESRFSGTWWFTYVIASLLVLGFTAIVKSTIWLAIGRTSPQIANGMIWVVAIVLSLGLSVPSAGSVIFLSGSRLEDQIAVKASGIKGIETFAFSADSFVLKTGILLALVVIVIRILKGFAISAEIFAFSALPEDKQREAFQRFKLRNPAQAWFFKAYTTTEGGGIDYAASDQSFDQAPYTEASAKSFMVSIKAGIKWGLLSWLFLPRALTLVALCLWVVPIGRGLISFIVSWKTMDRLRKPIGEA